VALAVVCVPGRAEVTLTSTEIIVRLRVRPMAAPKPALRYLLLPELKEQSPGNPVVGYLRCVVDQEALPADVLRRRENLLTLQLKDLPGLQVRDYGGAALRRVDWAARLDRPDWLILPRLKTDGIGLLLPDLQKMRSLAFGLNVRFRTEVAQGRFDDALGTAKTLFALSRHCGEHPTLIGELVGIAIAFVAIGPLEEMLEQPGCPNLYWALTDLPSPLVNMRGGMEGERVSLRGEFRDLDDAAPMTTEQIERMMAHLDNVRKGDGGTKAPPTRAWLDERKKDAAAVDDARRRLAEAGIPLSRTRHFPADQVMLLDQWRDYEVRRDEFMKLMNLPHWQIETLTPSQQGLDKTLFGFLLPALDKVHRAQGRLEQRVALLRHVEALRLYAAAHHGKLPDRLADIDVPLPDDPVTGRPFRYNLDANTAQLRGSPPPGQEKSPGFNVRYEVTIQK
jgi:hypothetical protein